MNTIGDRVSHKKYIKRGTVVGVGERGVKVRWDKRDRRGPRWHHVDAVAKYLDVTPKVTP